MDIVVNMWDISKLYFKSHSFIHLLIQEIYFVNFARVKHSPEEYNGE